MLQCDWEFILTLSEVFFLSRWLCCPVYLTVAHKWLCRQGAHTRGGYTLGCPGSGKHSVSQKTHPVKNHPWLRLTTRWSCAGVNRRDFTFCWVIPLSSWCVSVTSAGITQWLLSQWPCCIRSQTQVPPKEWYSSKTHWYYGAFSGSAFVWLLFASTSLAQKKNNTWTHFTKHSSFSFLSKVGLSEDGLSLLIRHKCSWLASCNVCYRAVLLVKKKSFQLRDRPYLRTCHLASLHGCSIGTFWVCFTNVIVFTHGPQISVWVFLSWP